MSKHIYIILIIFSNSVFADEFYVTARYYCVKADSGSNAGDCTITGRSTSCAAAVSQVNKIVNNAGDVCKNCADNIDNSKKWSGKSEWIHGGYCHNNENDTTTIQKTLKKKEHERNNTCKTQVNLRSLGYRGGHKTNYCLAQGFEGYNPNSKNCFKECVKKPKCKKVPIKQLGWTSGHKTKFCISKGFDGVHNNGDYKNGGYCFNPINGGTVADCK